MVHGCVSVFCYEDGQKIVLGAKTLAGAWAGGTEYGVNFVLLIKIVCLVLCVTSFPFVIFSADLKVFSYILCLIIRICVELKFITHARNELNIRTHNASCILHCCCCKYRLS
jgi:hypothetical protein